MNLELKIVAGADLAEKFDKAAGTGVHQAILHAVRGAQLDLANAMKRNIRAKFRQRSGDFARSIVSEPIEDRGAQVSGRTGSNLEYAQIQERGGEIRAKNVRNLTIPLEAFMTGRGLARGAAHSVIASPGNYGFDGTFFSHHILFGKRGEEAVPLFALKPSVTLPARPWAQPALDEIKPSFEAAMRSALQALL